MKTIRSLPLLFVVFLTLPLLGFTRGQGTGAGLTDPHTPGDGTMDVNGNIEATGFVSGTTIHGASGSFSHIDLGSCTGAGCGGGGLSNPLTEDLDVDGYRLLDAATVTVSHDVSTTNETANLLQLTLSTSGTAAAGIGPQLQFWAEYSNGTTYPMAAIAGKWMADDSGYRYSGFELANWVSATKYTRLLFWNNTSLSFNYGTTAAQAAQSLQQANNYFIATNVYSGSGGSNNTAFGNISKNLAGYDYSSLFGDQAGQTTNGADAMTLFGANAGLSATSAGHTFGGGYNVFYNSNVVTNTVALGDNAASLCDGCTGGVYIGYYAGYNHDTANELCIENSSAAACLIQGSFSSDTVTVNGQINSALPATLTPSGTAQTVDWNDGNGQILDLGSASGSPVVLTLSNPLAGASYVIKIIQGATARTLTWPAAVLWQGGTAITLSTGDDDEDVVSCWYDGTYYYCNSGVDYK